MKQRRGVLVIFRCLAIAVSLGITQLRAADSAEKVGQLGPNLYSTPVHQRLTPAGRQIELPGVRPQALALSPNGRWLAIAGKTPELIIADPGTGAILQRVPFPSNRTESHPGSVSSHILQPDKKAELSYTGLLFSPDGTRIYLASVNGTVKVFAVATTGKVRALDSFPLPPANAPRRELEIPAGLAISRDGKRLYVVFNLSNRLGELDAQSGQVLRTWDVGVAPYDVVLAGSKAYVSNWGGRRPEAQSVTGPAGRGTRVRVDSTRYIASEGSVSVIDLADSNGHAVRAEILTGLHASALAVSPDGRYLVVANAGSDTLSVIDTRDEQIVQTICARQNPADVFGASPNAVAFDRSGRRLFVCNGTQNAVAVFDFAPRAAKLLGLIPGRRGDGFTPQFAVRCQYQRDRLDYERRAGRAREVQFASVFRHGLAGENAFRV